MDNEKLKELYEQLIKKEIEESEKEKREKINKLEEFKEIIERQERLLKLLEEKSEYKKGGMYYKIYYYVVKHYLIKLIWGKVRKTKLEIIDFLNKRMLRSEKDTIIIYFIYSISRKTNIKITGEILEKVIKSIEENNERYINEIFEKYNKYVRQLDNFELELELKSIRKKELKLKLMAYLV